MQKWDASQLYSLCDSTRGTFPVHAKTAVPGVSMGGAAISRSAGPVGRCHPRKNFEILDVNSCYFGALSARKLTPGKVQATTTVTTTSI